MSSRETAHHDYDYHRNTSWMDAAACRGRTYVNFFPSKNESDAGARAICKACPVCEPCYEYAVADAGLHGVWGDSNMKQRERERVRRSRG